MTNRQRTLTVKWDQNDKILATYKTQFGHRRTVSELVIENIDNKNYIMTIITKHVPKILINL